MTVKEYFESQAAFNKWLKELTKTQYTQITYMLAEYAIHCRIQERKDCIYILEMDLMDEEDIYSEDYKKCMRDEIKNHQAFIVDLKNELEGL